jgi:NAD(P)-dependent dehydrogenase (short-subunit alcohol dehydrogenase family)
MKGKVCVVTGATSGIGLEIAGGLAELGATVVITGRNEDLGNQVVRDIKKRTGNSLIELMIADFTTQKEVHKLADRLKNRYDKIDVLVNNAGLYQPEHTITPDGVELTFAVNYLAPFLLTHLLLDPLRRAAPSRVVNMASSFHKRGYLDFENINFNNGNYSGMQAYMNSKLALLHFTYKMAKKLEPMGITMNAVHPGIVKTNLPRERKFYGFILRIIPFFLTAKQGAKTPIYLASSPEVRDVTGKYFIKKKPVKSSKKSYDKEMREKLWNLSLKLTNLNSDDL